MQAYGRKKHSTHIEGHQNCGICHPVQKSKPTRARVNNKKEQECGLKEVDYSDDCGGDASDYIRFEGDTPDSIQKRYEQDHIDCLDCHPEIEVLAQQICDEIDQEILSKLLSNKF